MLNHWSVEIIKFLKEYKQFKSTCHFSWSAMRERGGTGTPFGPQMDFWNLANMLILHMFYKLFGLAVIHVCAPDLQ